MSDHLGTEGGRTQEVPNNLRVFWTLDSGGGISLMQTGKEKCNSFKVEKAEPHCSILGILTERLIRPSAEDTYLGLFIFK